MATRSTQEDRNLLVKTNNRGVLRVKVPGGARVTYSNINPAKGGYGEHALRIYKGQTQLACFIGVTEFYDEGAITVQRRVKKVEREAEQRDDGRGNKRTKEKEKVEFEFVADEGAAEDGVIF